MKAKTYEELGREADMAARVHATAKRTVIEMGSPQAMAARIKVTIDGATWDNGLLHLVPFLQMAIGDRLTDLVPDAVSRMGASAEAAVAVLEDSVRERGGMPMDTGRQVPRQTSEIDTFDPSRLERPADLEDHAKDGSQAAKSPAVPEAGTMAPSGPSGGETGEGAGQVPLGHSLTTGQQTPPGKPPAVDPKLTPPQAESLRWIGENPGKGVAHTADIARLVNEGLVTRTGSGKAAAYTVTEKGHAHLAALLG